MKLYYFTDHYPYGRGNMWKQYELEILRKHFTSIVVIPLHSGGNKDKPFMELPQGVKSIKPLFEKMPNEKISSKDIFTIFDKYFFIYLREAFRANIFFSKARIVKWIQKILFVKKLLGLQSLKELLSGSDDDTVFYFFWGTGTADMISFARGFKYKKIVIKMHRFDLFEYVNDNYIPFRNRLIKNSDYIIPSSQAGVDHLQEKYSVYSNKFKVIRCGTVSKGISYQSSNEVLQIISCSWCIPVKRVHLIIEALALLPDSVKVEWRHIGSGELLDDLKEQAKKIIRSNVKVIFEGEIAVDEVINYYVEKEVDLFINVSESEGVPYSIMEAMSAGIPIFATKVGGTGEIVDDSIGKLLNENISALELSREIEKYYFLNSSAKNAIRINVKNRFTERCDNDILVEDLAKLLLS